VAPLLLRVFSALSACCRGGAAPGDLAEGVAASVAVVHAALGRRVPPLGVAGEAEGPPHLARWAAYAVLEALCRLPAAEGPRAVFSTPALGTSLLADGDEGSVKGRAHAQAVVAAAIDNGAAGPEFAARLREGVSAAREKRAAARAEPGVAVAERAA